MPLIPREEAINFGTDAADVHEFLDAGDFSGDEELTRRLVAEEQEEVLEAFAHLLKEMADLRYVVLGHVVSGHDPETLPKVDDAIEFLFDMIPDDVVEQAFNRVHASNMSKVDPETGKVVKREDGKIVKGPNYKPPVLGDLVRDDQPAPENLN